MATSPNKSLKNTHEGTPYNAKNQEAMLIQDGYCSPERPSYKGSSKQTPKSILKEYIYSGSKSKKGIIINETLNETRKLSLKSEASEDSAAKHSRVSDFEKAQAQKRQREREQEIYCEMIRRSNLNTEEAQAAQNADLGKDATYEENRQLLRNFEQKRRSLDNGDSKRSLQSLSSIGYVEEKIQQLEKCLDIYSNRLRDSILRQRDQLLASHYRKTGDIASHNHTGTVRSWEENENPVKTQEYQLQEDPKVHKGKNKQTKPQNSSARSKSSQHWEELDHDLKQLRQESNYLKSKLQAPENIFESSSKQDKQYSSNNTHDKEIELLKTVEQIRAKLYNSIAQRSIQERNNQTKTNSSFKKTKIRGLCSDKDTKTKNAHIPPKYQKVREAYGEKTLERENACILNQGLSTTYSGFHWNADQSLKITRNV